MKNKQLITIALVVSLVLSLVGCTGKQPGGDTASPDQAQNAQNDMSQTTMNKDDKTISEYDVIADEKFVWEKEASEISQSTIKLTENWDESIEVDGSIVYSAKATDLSIIPNYYYHSSDDSYGELETAYYVPTSIMSVKSKNTQIGTYSFADMELICTTMSTEEISKHVIVDEVRFVCVTNPYEGGFDELKTKAYCSNNEFGIGSEYKYVIGIIGAASEIVTESMGNGLNITTCTYISDSAELVLSFMWFEKDGIDSAILMSTDWIATDLRSMLRMQDGMY